MPIGIYSFKDTVLWRKPEKKIVGKYGINNSGYDCGDFIYLSAMPKRLASYGIGFYWSWSMWDGFLEKNAY